MYGFVNRQNSGHMHFRRAKPLHSAGFTMLELVVSVALLAIITGAIVPIYANSMNAIQQRNARHNFVSLITFIQERAVAETREYRLYIDQREQVFWVEFQIDEDLEGKHFVMVEEDYGRLQPVPRNLEIQQVRARRDRSANAQYIGCYPNGASDIARVVFRDTRDFRSGFEIETQGSMGKIEVKVQ